MIVLASGYPSIDHIVGVSHSPQVGETALLERTLSADRASFGGCGANVAVGLRRLGHASGVAIVVGDDAYGKQYQAYLEEVGVNTANLIMLEQEQTSQSYLFRNTEGEYQNFFFPGAADVWDEHLVLREVDELRYGLLTVGAIQHNEQFRHEVIARRIPLIWQLKPDIYAYPPESIQGFAYDSQIIIMNYLEARYVLDTLGYQEPTALLQEGKTEIIVVTSGSKGVIAMTKDQQVQVDAIPITVVDSTGAGDAFTSGFIAGLLEDQPLQTCVHWGVTMASFVLEKVGCQTNIPQRNQLIARYEEYFT